MGVAGRAAWGLGKRLGGRPAEAVAAEMQARTAEQLFKVLGELKGGAMKFGQALSIFESALPEELAAPYRATLTKLQDAAPPMPATHRARACSPRISGRGWRRLFRDFDDRPAAAASIGQVHRATWKDGRAVAVKVQYPGAGAALLSDLNSIGRLGRLVRQLGARARHRAACCNELKERVAEELDYRLEAEATAAFAEAYAGSPEIRHPGAARRHRARPGHRLARGHAAVAGSSPTGTKEQRDAAGLLYVRFLFSGPALRRAAARRPAPRQLPRSCRTGVSASLDFGAVARLPERPAAVHRPADADRADRRRPRRSSPACARRASSSPPSTSTPSSSSTTWRRSSSRRRSSGSSSTAPGCASSSAASTTRASRATPPA